MPLWAISLDHPALVEITEEARKLVPDGEFAFSSRQARGNPLSNMAPTMVSRRLDATAHGFRSIFRDWVSEETDFPSEVAEMALAYTIENRVEAAYRRLKEPERRETNAVASRAVLGRQKWWWQWCELDHGPTAA